MPHIELFYLIIPISLIFIVCGLYLYINIRKKWLDMFFEKHKMENSPSSNQIYTNELRSLSLVKNNNKTDTIKDEAATMVWEINKLKRKNYDFSLEGKQKIDKYQVFASNKLFVGIVENETKINELSKKFFDTVGMVLENIKEVRKEIRVYKGGLRDLKQEILTNISELSNPKSKTIILAEFGKIEINLKSLDDLVSSNQIEKAIIEFSNIKQYFLNLINFSNNCVELENVIFNKMPEYFQRLEVLFEQAKKNTKCDLNYISFYHQIETIKIQYNYLINSFSIENLIHIKSNTDKILLSLSNLNNEINCEINSYTFMLKNKNNLNEYKKGVAKLFISIKNDFTAAYQIDKIYFSQFEDEINKLLNYLTEIDSWINKIEKDEDNFDISFSSKQFKYKSLFYQLKGFYFLYVELNKKMEIFYLEGESNLLKFERLIMLLRTMNSYVKMNYIILTPDEVENGKQVESIRQKIVDIILNTPNGTSPNIVNEYKKLLSLVVEYVSTVGLKIEISKIFIKVAEILAPKRSSDIKLNESIILSENCYLDGNYQLALDNIISTLNKGVN